jgi:hypothetical protein
MQKVLRKEMQSATLAFRGAQIDSNAEQMAPTEAGGKKST